MIKYQKACKVCNIIKAEGGEAGGKAGSSLLNRIYQSRRFISDGEAMTLILADYEKPPHELKYLSLYNHAHKHQTLTETELAEGRINRLENQVQGARMEATVAKYTAQAVRDALKSKGMEKLANDEVKGWTVSALAKLAKDEDDVAAKTKDQQIKVLGMIEGFQSGQAALLAGSRDDAIDLSPEDYSILPTTPAV